MSMNILNLNQMLHLIESGNINFLIGSGVSKPFLSTLGNIEKWLTELELAQKGSSLYIHKEQIKLSIYSTYLNDVMRPCLKSNKVGSDFEKTNYAYTNFFKTINSIIAARASSIISKQINVFTTNIDDFCETTSCDAGVEINDGFKGHHTPIYREDTFTNIVSKISGLYQTTSTIPVFNIVKIHGSINWKKHQSNDITFDHKLEVLQGVLELLDSIPKNYLLKFKDGVNSIAEMWDDSEFDDIPQAVDEKIKEFFIKYDELIMINPQKDKFVKSVIDYHFYELMRLYSNALEKKNSVLFVAGFSFADEHISNITLRAANNNPTLSIIVLAFDDDAKAQIDNNLEKIGTSHNNNIFIATPNLFIKAQDESFKEKLNKETFCFDLTSIDKYIFQNLLNLL